MRHRRTMLGVAGVVVVAVAGCGGSGTAASQDMNSSQRASSSMVVPTLVVRGPVGPAAFVRVTIKARPYIFKVDTGAVKTVVNAIVAKTLALPDRGVTHSATTLGCKTSAQSVVVSDWKLGNASLPAMTIASTSRFLAGEKIQGLPVSGLLGSDVLSRFGIVTLDFAGKRLILGGQAPSGGHSIPMTVVHRKHGGLFVTMQAAIHGKPAGYVIDTGSSSPVIESRTVTHLDLQAIGKSLLVYGAAGCSAIVTPVRVDNWTAGGVKLPSTIGLSSRSSVINKFEGKAVVGVIGANVLSAFGEVTLDFRDSRMVLGGTAG